MYNTSVMFGCESSFFHNSRLIRWIQQNKVYQKFWDLTKDWTQIPCLVVSHSNHYIRMFLLLHVPHFSRLTKFPDFSLTGKCRYIYPGFPVLSGNPVLVWGWNWIQFMHGWFCPICLIHLIRWNISHFEEKKLNVLLGGLRLKINTNKRQQLSAADLRKLPKSVKSSKTANAFPWFLFPKNILFKSLFQHVQINRNVFSTAVEV